MKLRSLLLLAFLSVAPVYSGVFQTKIPHLTLADVQRVCESLPVRAANLGTGENGLHPEFQAIVHDLRDHIVKNADNVGERFATEARAMHYGDKEHRPIYGEASPDEAKSLIDEGIEVSPLPTLPEDRN